MTINSEHIYSLVPFQSYLYRFAQSVAVDFDPSPALRNPKGSQQYQKFKSFGDELKNGYSKSVSSLGGIQSNGQAENSVKTVKRLFKKAQSDPWMALLEYRNTPIEGMGGYAPSEILNGRLLRAKLPAREELLQTHSIPKLQMNIISRQQRQKLFYDERAGKDQIFQPRTGEKVRFRNQGKWELGRVVEQSENPRAVVVQSQSGRMFKRNRRHVFVSGEHEAGWNDHPGYTVADFENDEREDQEFFRPGQNLEQVQEQRNVYNRVPVRENVTTRSGRVSRGVTRLDL